MKGPIVAIDGPAGAGKSTVSFAVARELGYVLVDTGALYRAVALAAARAGVAFSDGAAVARVARAIASPGRLALEPDAERGVRVELDGEDVSTAIRAQEMGQGASIVSAHPEVREALLLLQRKAGVDGAVVLEGRDIGTVVFPDARAKFFLTASVEVRARRRYDELVLRGESPLLAEVAAEVALRDQRDSTRPVAPLSQAADAELVDSSAMTIAEVVHHIVGRVRAIARNG